MIRPIALSALLATALLVPAPTAANPAGDMPAVAEPGGVNPTAGDLVRDRPPARQTRVYLGMWTSHTKDPQRGVDANSLLGAAYRGVYGGTFVNSYGDRAYALGIQRSTTPSRRAALKTALGYRMGLVTGYDERFLPIAAQLPAMPFAQLTGSIDRGRAGAELAFAGLTLSLLASVRL